MGQGWRKVPRGFLGLGIGAALVASSAGHQAAALPMTPDAAQDAVRDAANAGRLPALVARWRAAYDRTKSPLLAYAYAQAVGMQRDLSLKSLVSPPAGLNPREVYAMLEAASRRETKAAYPVVATYYWLSQYPENVLGFDPRGPSRTTPYVVHDESGKVVARDDAEIYDKADARLAPILDGLYAEMVRRAPNDPYVTYVGAMRQKDARAKVALLKAAAARGGLERFKASLLASTIVAQREAGDMRGSRATEADLNAFLAPRSKAVTVRFFKLSHPELFPRG